jgi:hypothetical protein
VSWACEVALSSGPAAEQPCTSKMLTVPGSGSFYSLSWQSTSKNSILGLFCALYATGMV